MEPFTGLEIRDFRLRSNYLNHRILLFLRDSRDQNKRGNSSTCPGYSRPVVDYELHGGIKGSVEVDELDVPRLCHDDIDVAKAHLAKLLNASSDGCCAVSPVATTLDDDDSLLKEWEMIRSAESEYVVPCSSSEPHSDHDISQKAFILLKLMQLGYPVPDFVVLTTKAYAEQAERLEHHLGAAMDQLQLLTREGLGSSDNALVFAVRCATAHYIPGVMDTFLNVGITERTLPGLEQKYGSVAARKMFLNTLRNLCNSLENEHCTTAAGSVRSDLSPDEVSQLIDRLSGIVRKSDTRLIEDAFFQTSYFIRQGYKHFEENHDLLATLCRGPGHYPSVILQKMVCTVIDDHAYAGVVSSRHTQTGVGIELQTARNIFGEELMTGTAEIEATVFDQRDAIRDTFPAVSHFVPHLADLETDFEAPVTIEFAVEAKKRYEQFALLQLNETGMSGRAAVTAVVDLHKSGTISRRRVTELIRPYHLKQLTSDSIDQDNFETLSEFCSGIAVLPRSAVSVRVYFSGDAALKAKSQGEKVCLCKKTFVPTDTVVMREMDAIISLTSAAVHVVTICQSLGIPALLSVEKYGVTLHPEGRLVNAWGREVTEGDWITISSRRRTVFEGKAKYTPARLLRYMRGEPVQMEPEERKAFESIAYAYRYYQQLVKGLTVAQISTLNEITRLVNFDLRGESEEARQLVNGWFDDRETLYMEEVLKSDIGDHLSQSNVFDMLSLDRKIRFFKLAAAKLAREHISGYEAGAFMLGRFLSLRYPAAFWKCFTPLEIGLLVNEWVLFEKYMQLLQNVGERKVLHARKKILKEGLNELYLHPGSLQSLITLKLAGVPLDDAKQALPEWTDRQSVRVLELLQQPYRAFYDFHSPWSLHELEKICREEDLAVPAPEDV